LLHVKTFSGSKAMKLYVAKLGGGNHFYAVAVLLYNQVAFAAYVLDPEMVKV